MPDELARRRLAGAVPDPAEVRTGVRHATAVALDAVILFYAAALALVLSTGGIDLGLISLTGAEKPILILLLALPVRLALDERSWLLERARAAGAAAASLVRFVASGWLSPAVADVAFALVATRVASFSIGFIANLLFGQSAPRAFEMPFTTEKFAEIFAAWDSGWYFDIARRGYYFNPDGQSSVAFFPLYPLLMRALAWPFGGTDKAIWLAGIVISCAAFALALVVLHRFTHRMFGDREVARRTVLYLAVFPFSLFFTRVYAESLLLLMTVLAISDAYEHRWWRAGVWAALATLTRPNGILIGLPLLLLALRGRPSFRDLTTRAGALSLAVLAMGGYCVYVYGLSGDPLGWLASQQHWNYSLGNPPWQQLLQMIDRMVRYGIYDYFFVSAMAPFRLFHGVTGLLFLVLTPAVFKRFGVPLGAYMLVSLLVPLSGDALEGIGRYSAVLFPAFMVVGSVRSSRVHEAILIAASLFLALFVCLFVTLRPIY